MKREININCPSCKKIIKMEIDGYNYNANCDCRLHMSGYDEKI